jgi:gluconolactonase
VKRLTALILLAACGDDGTSATIDAAVIDSALPAIDAFAGDPLIGAGLVTLVDMGYQFTEGPQWRATEGDLVFTDIPANTIYRYNPTAPSLEILRMPSGNANGLAIDNTGALIAAQHSTRSVTRNATAIANMFEGVQLNSPNDVIVASDGTIYFTDPPYGLPNGELDSDLNFMGVFQLTPTGTLTAEHRGAVSERPNGIGISPDGSKVYVADTADGKLWSFARQTDGSLSPRVMLAMTAGGADGLAIDAAGNIFVTSTAGVEVFSPTGTKWGTISVPMQPSNCAFGDADYKTLYITARTSLYKVKLANPGLPRN